MDYTAIERKLFFFCFVIIFYDILRYTVPKTRRAVLLDIWFDLMSLVTSYLVQGRLQDGQSLSPPKYFEGFFKKKLFYYVGGRVKSKTLMFSTDLNNSSCHH